MNKKINFVKTTENKVGKIMVKKLSIGILAGFISGFFASGGGLILIPAFIGILKIEPKTARGTAICCILPMTIASSIFYYKNNNINWKLGLLCALGGALGGYIGAKILNKISDKYLKLFFIVFLTYMSIRLLIF